MRSYIEKADMDTRNSLHHKNGNPNPIQPEKQDQIYYQFSDYY